MLKTIFNFEVSYYKTKHPTLKKLKEPHLFDCLNRAISNTFYSASSVNQCHGPAGYVDYNPYPNRKNSFDTTCEISDLLIVFFGNNECRYTFMQNKNSNSKNIYAISRADATQYHLLSHRYHFAPHYSTLVLGGDELKKAKLCTVGSYGDFCRDKATGLYDMRFFCANDLKANKKYQIVKGKSGPSVKLELKPSLIKRSKIRVVGGLTECFYCSTLDVFEQEARNMHIGTPLFKRNSDGTMDLSAQMSNTIIQNIMNAVGEDKRIIPESMRSIMSELLESERKNDYMYIQTIVINVEKYHYYWWWPQKEFDE